MRNLPNFTDEEVVVLDNHQLIRDAYGVGKRRHRRNHVTGAPTEEFEDTEFSHQLIRDAYGVGKRRRRHKNVPGGIRRVRSETGVLPQISPAVPSPSKSEATAAVLRLPPVVDVRATAAAAKQIPAPLSAARRRRPEQGIAEADFEHMFALAKHRATVKERMKCKDNAKSAPSLVLQLPSIVLPSIVVPSSTDLEMPESPEEVAVLTLTPHLPTGISPPAHSTPPRPRLPSTLDNVDALQEISAVARQICKNLSGDNEEPMDTNHGDAPNMSKNGEDCNDMTANGKPATLEKHSHATKVLLAGAEAKRAGAEAKRAGAEAKRAGTEAKHEGDLEAVTMAKGSEPPSGSTIAKGSETSSSFISKADKLAAKIATVPGLPCLKQHLHRVLNGSAGFFENDVSSLRAVFNRFRVPHTNEVHKDILGTLVHYLGHHSEDKSVQRLADEVTAFSYMDFDEFMLFMEKFSTLECERIHAVFQQHDVDKKGTISVQELRKLLVQLRLLPPLQMVNEAVEVADLDGTGLLNFQSLMCVLTIYRHTQGFCSMEVTQLRRVFDRFAILDKERGDRLPPDQLKFALTHMFGVHASGLAALLEENILVMLGRGGQEATNTNDNGLQFSEFLISARELREAEAEMYQAEFNKYDNDRSGYIEMHELSRAIKGLGYSVCKSMIREVLSEVLGSSVDEESDIELDFDQFFNFMVIMRRQEGFSRAELDKLQATFLKFDVDKSGEISVDELSAIIRSMGYAKDSFHDLNIRIAQVDVNGNGSLDFREFTQLMRLQHEAELARIGSVFHSMKDNQSCKMLVNKFGVALKELGYNPPESALELSELGAQVVPAGLQTFRRIVDQCRANYVAEKFWWAGFSEEEIDLFRNLFDNYDKDGSGEIDGKELQKLLKDLSMSPRTRQEREQLIDKLNMARAAAKEAGVIDSTEVGTAELKFWELVQLLRVIQNNEDIEAAKRLELAKSEAGFSAKEVASFREVFLTWSKNSVAGVAGRVAGGISLTQRLNRDNLRRLLSSKGLSIAHDEECLLNLKVTHMVGKGNEGQGLDFAGFIRLMKWMLDTDFAGINEVKF